MKPRYLIHLTKLCTSLLSLALYHVSSVAEEPQQSDYYTITQIPAPEGAVVEGGAIELLPDGKVAVCTRRGQVWMIENAFSHPDKSAKWTLFAEYLHEPLGLAWKDGWLYAVQRPELTRMKDEDGDGRADIFETVNDDWGINGNYHEYTFGSRFDDEGYLWTTLCLTGSFTAESKYRGWVLRINDKGEMIPTASGVRSPGGIGFNKDGDVFYTDNQGAWNGSSSLKWVKPGSFQGNPNGNIWYDLANGKAGERPVDPLYTEEGSRTVEQREKNQPARSTRRDFTAPESRQLTDRSRGRSVRRKIWSLCWATFSRRTDPLKGESRLSRKGERNLSRCSFPLP